ncbi:MAG: right-handed parallel beta-helix repeat-containing protein, partial [Bacteroidetes bacterium]|nr:right-handed parallel beta-helix repeat-containing protein [Bacteroidota bacterium]
MKHIYKGAPLKGAFLVLLFMLITTVSGWAQLSGTYTIDPGSSASSTNYQSFDAAVGDLISGSRSDGGSANGSGVSGAVIFNVADGAYDEQMEISAISGASSSYTITFQGASGDSSKVHLYKDAYDMSNTTYLNYVIQLNGCEWVNFKDMSIEVTNGSGNYYGTCVRIDGGSNNNSFTSCQIRGTEDQSWSTYDAAITSDWGYQDTGNHFTYCGIHRGAYYGCINLYGAYSTSYQDVFYFDHCDIDSNPMYYNIQANYTQLHVTNSNIGATGYPYGMNIYLQYCRSSIITGNRIGDNYYPVYLYDAGGISSKHCKIANNFITSGAGYSYSYCSVYLGSSTYTDLVYNNIYYEASYGYYSAVNVSSSSTGSIIKNNNIVTNYGNKIYDIYPTMSSGSINYNNYYQVSSGSFGTYNSSTYSSFSSWKSGTSKDANSLNVDPSYNNTATNDLHINNTGLNAKGVVITGYTRDFDGDVRNTSTPDIGADEISPVSDDAGITDVDSPSTYCAGNSKAVYVHLKNAGLNTLTSATIKWWFNGTAQTDYVYSGSLASGSNTSVMVGTKTFSGSSNTVAAKVTNPNGGADGNAANDSVSSTLGASLSGSKTIGGSSPDYATFALAVAALNANGVCGAVTFNVRNGSYTESITLDPIQGASATNTITFQSQSLDSTKVTLQNGSTVITLNGADFVTFQKMTIKQTSGSYTIEFKGGAHKNKILNNRIYNYQYGQGLYEGGSSLDTGNLISNNVIKYGYAIYFYGSYSSHSFGNTFTYNQIDSAYYYAILCINQDRLTIDHNTVTNFPYYGVLLEYCDTRLRVTNNNINTPIGCYAGLYLYDNTCTSGIKGLIANNTIAIVPGSYNGYGINMAYNSYLQVVYNNVNIYSATATSSAALYSYSYGGGNNVLYNNNFVNNSNGYAMYVGVTSYFSAINYNNLYTSGSNLTYYGGSAYSDLASHQSGSGVDANSVSVDPLYTSNTNLHVFNAALNGTATPITDVTTDMDGTTRNATTPDIGSDEFTPPADDAGITSIDSPSNYCGGTSYNIYVTLLNGGINTLTSASIKMKVNGGTASTYSYTGSLASGTSVSINIGSLSMAANTVYNLKVWSESPNGVADVNHVNDTTAVAKNSALNGSKTIGGSSPDFATFTAAVTALSSRGVCGATTFNVRDGSYNEYVTIPAITGASATNTITFQSQSLDSTKVTLYRSGSATSPNYVVGLVGAEYIIFNKMTIMRQAASYVSTEVVRLISGASHNTFKNSILKGITSSYNYGYVVFDDYSSLDSANTFNNNIIRGGYYTMYLQGNYSTHEVGYRITNNTIDSSYYYQIYCVYQNDLTITGNKITNKLSSYGYAIMMQYVTDNTYIRNNKIDLPTGGYGIYLNYYCSPASGTGKITNNMIAINGINYNAYGIYAYYSQNWDIYYNNINIYNTSSYNANGYCLYNYYYYSANNWNIKNNNLVNTNRGYALYSYYYYSPVFTSCNYNNLYNAGGGSYALVSYNGSTYYTLSSWQSSGSGYDANSVSMDPTFTSNTDLHTSAAGIKKKGTPISGLTTDYDGEFRNALKPTIGADEPTPSPYDAVITAYITPVANYCVGTNNVTITLTNNGSVTLVSDSIAWSVNGTTQTPYQWTGSLAAGSSSNITLGTYSFVSGVYNVVATSYKPNGNSDNDNSNDTLSSVNLKAALSGTKTIGGSSPTYSTFALAVADLTTYGVCAPLIFNVRDGSYNQRISIGNVPGASAINTVTFQSQSLDSTKVNLYNSTSNSASNITLNGCDFVKFSKMTIQRTGSVYGSYGTLVTIQNTSTNNTFSHCRIIGVKSPYYYSSFYNIYKYGTTDDSANTFDQNSITNGSYSFHYYNYSGSTNGLVIKNNYIDSVRTYGLYCYYINNINMTGNYLRVLANGSSDYSNTYGLYLQYCNTITAISKNKIFVETGYYGGNGMYFYYGNGSSSLISNNWISTTTTSTYSYLNYANIYCYFSKGNFFYNNSLYSNMGASSTYQANFYMYDYNSGNNTRFVNNINVNTSSTGQVMFVYYTYYMGQMDYNDFWQPNGGSFGMCNYSTTADLSTWKSYSGKEASSISKDPKYVSATNLHAKGIGINNKGVSYSGVTTDIDGETRGTTPDIGSDEFTPDSLDMAVTLNSPSVNFCLGTQNVVVTLTNQGLSTVTSENIAWSVNGSAQTPYSWTGSLAVGQSSNVTIGTYTYSTGNVYNVAFTISLPNGLTDGEPANDTISAVNVKEALTGTKTIGGSSPDYATFTAAAAALNTFGVCGAVVFNVRDGSYNEYITLNAIAGTSATNTITFQSQSLDYTKVSLNYATGSSIYVVTLNGADFVTFNKMTIERTGSGSNYYGAVIQIMNGANNNNFTYNRIRSVYPSYEYFPHYLVYSAGTNDTANHFTNNIMRNGQGFYWFGASSGSQESGTVISNNDMDSITQNQFYYHKNMTISNNIMKVMNVNYTSTSMYGINMYYVDKSNISYNKISLTGSPDYENCGIYMYYCASSSTKAVNIFNNFISVGGSSSYYTTYGIYDNYYNNYVNMYYNNINVYGASNSIGLYIYYNAGANNAENNNIVNTGGGQAVSMYGYSGIGTVDYNNYYITGSTFGDWQYTSQSSFSDWQSNTGNDANGQNVDPGYTSNTDLHVSAPTLDGAATVITSITDDIDGTTRHTSTPDIGADEFAVATDDAGITGLANTPCAGSQNINVTLKNFGLTTLTSATIYYSINGATPSSYSWTGSLVSGTSASVTVGTYTFSSSSTYTFKSYSTVPNGVTDGNHANDTFYNGSLQTSLGGTYTIGGTSPSFATFTLAATALNTRGLCAAAIFNVRDGAYNEKISLSAITGSSASKTVTFQSQSGDSSKVSIYYIGSTSSTNDYVVELDGADYVTFKDLTINRSNGGSLSNYYYYRTAVKVSGGANHNKFINNRLISENNYYYYAGDAVISGGGYDDLLIQGNHISGGYYSIYLQGGYYSHDNNLRILDNEIDSSYNGGVYPYYSDS